MALRGFSWFDAMPFFGNSLLEIGPKLDAMRIESIPKFTGPAATMWAAISADAKKQLLSNVWCGKCQHEVIISNFTGTVRSRACCWSVCVQSVMAMWREWSRGIKGGL